MSSTKKEWAQIEFKFRSTKAAFRFGRFLSFGKEIGIVPQTIELQFTKTTVVIGHWRRQ